MKKSIIEPSFLKYHIEASIERAYVQSVEMTESIPGLPEIDVSDEDKEKVIQIKKLLIECKKLLNSTKMKDCDQIKYKRKEDKKRGYKDPFKGVV